MLPILRSDQAEKDLEEILDYLEEKSTSAAEKLQVSLEERFRLLSEIPKMGNPREDLAPGLRSIVVGHYVVFYQETEQAVEIVRILHGKRDIATIFREMKSDPE